MTQPEFKIGDSVQITLDIETCGFPNYSKSFWHTYDWEKGVITATWFSHVSQKIMYLVKVDFKPDRLQGFFANELFNLNEE